MFWVCVAWSLAGLVVVARLLGFGSNSRIDDQRKLVEKRKAWVLSENRRLERELLHETGKVLESLRRMQ